LPSEPRWITAAELIWINDRQVAATGEPHHLRDAAALESAAMRPVNHWSIGGERDALRLAATLLAGIVRNHPFVQGNKRTATVAALMFLGANGYTWTRRDDGELAEWVLALIDNEITEDELAELMRPYME
jgi:death-on-curing protein